VAFLVCSAPLFTALLTLAVKRFGRGKLVDGLEDIHVGWPLVTGTLLALAGMALVVFERQTLQLSPKGDLFAIGAAVCWALYSIFMAQMTSEYGALFATRKVFFYGLLTIIPYFICKPEEAAIFNGQWTMINGQCSMDNVQWSTIGSLLFLGIVASLLCFLVWNWVIRKLGAVVATNWVYFNPITTIVFAAWLLREPITPWFLLGTVLILLGMYLCDRRVRREGV
jgi:drug/metabolite transporter (DMT)-like permease